MEDITKYSEFEDEEILEIPRSIFEKWLASIKSQELTMNQSIFVIDEIQDFLNNYYDNQMELSDPEEVAKNKMENEIDELSSDDKNPTFIKKFEEI